MSEASPQSDLRTYRRLLEYVRVQWVLFALSTVGFGIYAASHVAFAELLAVTLDAVQDNAAGNDIGIMRYLIPSMMVAAVLARGMGTFMGQYFLALVSNNIVHRLRCQLFDQLLLLPSAYYDKSSQGHLVSRVTYTVAQVTGAATKAIEVIVREGLTVIGLSGWLLYMNWRLTAVFLVIAPVIGLVVRWANRRFRRASRKIQNSMGDVTHVAAEAVQGYREVRTFGGSDYERQRFGDSSDYNRKQSVKMAVIGALSSPMIQLFVAVALALMVFLILQPELIGGMSQGQVVSFITAAGLLTKPIRQLSEINAVIQRGLAAAEDIFAQFDEASEPDAGTLDVQRVSGRLQFDNVTFGYVPGREPVLHGIQLDIEPGNTIALVGRSGSGKSTLASLIPRFYEPWSGRILLDGEPLTDYRLDSLRRQLALVSQNVTLFNDTVRNNIAYGGLAGADGDAVEQAARRAHAMEFIEDLPEGLDTLIGDDGVLLSGGQRQRLAIARAILKDAPVLILDEATSALDSESEQHIQEALAEVMRGRTTLVIAHRLSTIENANRIVVMDEGRIVEQGTHAQLLAKGGAYAQLRALQFGATEALRLSNDGVAAETTPGGGPLERNWYGGGRLARLLAPLGSVTGWVAQQRYRRHASGKREAYRAPVPVIIVGNLTVGGTGKTPMVIWLVRWLGERGLRPGVVARGYSGRVGNAPLMVDADADPAQVGDEAPLIAAATGVPVIVHPDRGAAAEQLAACGVNIIISDDGLQHYALQRDVEIAMLDGARGTGNGRCLPAGPLREPLARLDSVDFIVSTGPLRAADRHLPHFEVEQAPVAFVHADGSSVALEDGPARGAVHGVAGIGHPARFFETLRGLGYQVIEHPLDDHHVYTASDIAFADDLPVIVSEKDMVRIRRLDAVPAQLWALRIEARPETGFVAALAERIDTLAAAFDAPGPDATSDLEALLKGEEV